MQKRTIFSIVMGILGVILLLNAIGTMAQQDEERKQLEAELAATEQEIIGRVLTDDERQRVVAEDMTDREAQEEFGSANVTSVVTLEPETNSVPIVTGDAGYDAMLARDAAWEQSEQERIDAEMVQYAAERICFRDETDYTAFTGEEAVAVYYYGELIQKDYCYGEGRVSNTVFLTEAELNTPQPDLYGVHTEGVYKLFNGTIITRS